MVHTPVIQFDCDAKHCNNCMAVEMVWSSNGFYCNEKTERKLIQNHKWKVIYKALPRPNKDFELFHLCEEHKHLKYEEL